MQFSLYFFRYGCLFAALACVVAAVAVAPARAAPPVVSAAVAGAQQSAARLLKLRVVGGLATVSQFSQLEGPFWTQELVRLSQGRYSAEIVAFDRAAVPGMQMLQLLQLGVVPFGTMLMSHVAAQYPQYAAPDLAGLNPDIAQLRMSLAAFRPYLEKSLREQHGIEALAIYIYPAQVLFCKKPLSGLADLAGRRIRVSSSSQGDFVVALGGVPVRVEFSRVMEALSSGALDCAITAASSGNTLGLHTVTSHLHTMPFTWGMAIFGANSAAWNALPADLQVLLRTELPRLEARVWHQAERETVMGVNCNRGLPACGGGALGHMALGHMAVVPMSVQDERLREQIFYTTVLPRWLQRCGPDCAALWRDTIGAARGIALPVALPVAGSVPP